MFSVSRCRNVSEIFIYRSGNIGPILQVRKWGLREVKEAVLDHTASKSPDSGFKFRTAKKNRR